MWGDLGVLGGQNLHKIHGHVAIYYIEEDDE